MAGRKVDPLFRAIKAEINAARDRLREEMSAQKPAKGSAAHNKIEARFRKLKDCNKMLGFPALDNIKPR